jgi:hypothetical protein
MTEIKQCWAFHRDGARCEHPAGHNGDHAVQKTWNDLQCATPGEFDISEPAQPLPSPLVEKTLKCVACGHSHKSGPCKCGCHEFIG